METIDTQIETGLQILDQKESQVREISEKFKGLSIKGADDKEGYKAVRAARITLKNTRVEIQNDGKELRENAVKFQKAVIKREKELIALIEPIENDLQREEDHYDALIDQIRIEEERKENQRIQARVDALRKFGHDHDIYDLKIMADDKFNELLTQAEIDFNAEQERIAKEKAEAEAVKKAEQERLRIEREALEIQRAEQAKKDAELKAELERLQKERHEQEKAQAAKDAQMKAEREKFEAEKRTHEESIRLEAAKKEAAERARIEEQEKVKREAEAKIEAERLAKIEAARQEALKPDKDKLLSLAIQIGKIQLPTMTTQEAGKVLGNTLAQLQKTQRYINDEVEKL